MVSQETTYLSSDLSFAPLTESNKTLFMKQVMRKRSSKHTNKNRDYICYLLLGLVLFITVTTYPYDYSGNKVTVQHVWYNGWITAVATGAGVLPFIFLQRPNKYWMGISNGKPLRISSVCTHVYSLSY